MIDRSDSFPFDYEPNGILEFYSWFADLPPPQPPRRPINGDQIRYFVSEDVQRSETYARPIFQYSYIFRWNNFLILC